MDNSIDERKEQRAVEYLKSQIDENKTGEMLAIYKQIIDKKVFHTRVGYDFLDDLRSRLINSGEIDMASIPEFAREEEPPTGIPEFEKEEPPARAPKPAGPPPGEQKSQKAPKTKKVQKPQKTKAKSAGQKPESDPPTKKSGPFPVFVFSVFLNVVLFIMVAIMFVLTVTSDSPNIINYRDELENEYSVWDEDLKRREKELKKKEAELIKREQALSQQEALQDTAQGSEPEAPQENPQDIQQEAPYETTQESEGETFQQETTQDGSL